MPDAALSAAEIVARVETSFARQAFMATLGARLVRVAPGEVEIVLPVAAHLGCVILDKPRNAAQLRDPS